MLLNRKIPQTLYMLNDDGEPYQDTEDYRDLDYKRLGISHNEFEGNSAYFNHNVKEHIGSR